MVSFKPAAGGVTLLMYFPSWEPLVPAPSSFLALLPTKHPLNLCLWNNHGIALQLRNILSSLLYSQNYNIPLKVLFLGDAVFILFLSVLFDMFAIYFFLLLDNFFG